MVQIANDYTVSGFSREVERDRPKVVTQPNRVFVICVVVGGLACALLALARQRPPEMSVQGVSPSQFSLDNALTHIRTIAARPHPSGSAENTKVREYLVKTLTDEGLTPQIQELVLMGQTSEAPLVVRNVVARLNGSNNTRAVLLVAHHDTTDRSPGAADNGSSVAALLETARALKTGPPLRNDVIFLFTDREEYGLLGAHAFVAKHAWSKDVGLVLNFDARGNRGPVLMFETGQNNGWVIKEFARAAPHPFTSSVLPDLYRLLPNNTDFTVFRNQGLPGLNFAFIDGHAFYHQSTDTIENLDPRSVAHLGWYALSLTRHFGDLDLNSPTAVDNAIYFDLLGSTVISYPRRWTALIAVLVSALYVGILGIALNRNRVRASGILAGSLAFLINALAVPLVITSTYVILARFFPAVANASNNVTERNLYLAGCAALTIVIGALIYRVFARRMSVTEATLGGLFWWLLGTLLTSLFLQGGSYLFTWPLLLILLAHLSLTVLTHCQRPAVHLLLPAAGMFLSVILFVPFIYHASIALNSVLYGLAMCMFAFVVSLFLPLFGKLSPARGSINT